MILNHNAARERWADAAQKHKNENHMHRVKRFLPHGDWSCLTCLAQAAAEMAPLAELEAAEGEIVKVKL